MQVWPRDGSGLDRMTLDPPCPPLPTRSSCA